MKLESMRTPLLRYVLTLIRDFADAEDVAHEAVKSALANPDFDPDRDDNFGFVKQKVVWLVRDRGRRLAKSPKSLPADLIDHRSDLPAQALERHETCDRVRRAVARLSEALQEVILRHLRGMSHEQVAADLDLPVRTVYVRFHHAKAALRRCLEEGGE
jgi:RNA polymerase sigma factor (sigma-70 family)